MIDLFIVVRGGLVDYVGTQSAYILDNVRAVVIDLDSKGERSFHPSLHRVQFSDPECDFAYADTAYITTLDILPTDIRIHELFDDEYQKAPEAYQDQYNLYAISTSDPLAFSAWRSVQDHPANAGGGTAQ